MNVPADLKYTKTHEWVRFSGEEVTVGITDHAQTEMGDIVFVELPEIGDEFSPGQECAVLESVKAASDLSAPVSGKVIAVNSELDANPNLINSDPYGKGWIFKLKVKNLQETGNLIAPAEYASETGEEV